METAEQGLKSAQSLQQKHQSRPSVFIVNFDFLHCSAVSIDDFEQINVSSVKKIVSMFFAVFEQDIARSTDLSIKLNYC